MDYASKQIPYSIGDVNFIETNKIRETVLKTLNPLMFDLNKTNSFVAACDRKMNEYSFKIEELNRKI